MENQADYKTKKSGRMMEILTEVVKYVYYDESPENIALMISEIRFKRKKEIEALEPIMDEPMGEFQARYMFTTMLFEARLAEKLTSVITTMRPRG